LRKDNRKNNLSFEKVKRFREIAFKILNGWIFNILAKARLADKQKPLAEAKRQ
jgi:hypothetical protein